MKTIFGEKTSRLTNEQKHKKSNQFIFKTTERKKRDKLSSRTNIKPITTLQCTAVYIQWGRNIATHLLELKSPYTGGRNNILHLTLDGGSFNKKKLYSMSVPFDIAVGLFLPFFSRLLQRR